MSGSLNGRLQKRMETVWEMSRGTFEVQATDLVLPRQAVGDVTGEYTEASLEGEKSRKYTGSHTSQMDQVLVVVTHYRKQVEDNHKDLQDAMKYRIAGLALS